MLNNHPHFTNPQATLQSLIDRTNAFPAHTPADQGEKQRTLSFFAEGFASYQNPKRMWLSENFLKKVHLFFEDSQNTQKLLNTCRKIGFSNFSTAYCLGSSGGMILINILHNSLYYVTYGETGALHTIGQATFAPEGSSLPFSINVFYYDRAASKFAVEEKEEDDRQMAMTTNVGVCLLLTFLHFVEVKEVVMAPGQKYRPAKYEPVKNLNKRDFTVVDVSWDQPVEVPGFAVKGHYRMQPFGEKRQKVKLIYIQPFMKEGYTRKAGKDLER